MPSKPADIHATAARGFGAAADAYARGRPDYPPQVEGWLCGPLGLKAGRKVLDLGAGTGKFTGYLVATGADVIAVEPVAEMRVKLTESVPQAEALAGTAEAIPIPTASVDAVTCAQAFHWFATTTALAEIRRVLKPGGRLGLIWNWRDERVPWVARLAEIVNRFEGDTPRYRGGAWRAVFPDPGFGPLHETYFTYGHAGAPEDVIVNRVLSTSFIAMLPERTRAQIRDELIALIANAPELRGRAVVTMPYETTAIHTVAV